MVAVTLDTMPSRSTKSLLLAALILGPTLLGVLPLASANAATCTAAIDTFDVSEPFTEVGRSIVVHVRLKDKNPAQDVPPNKVELLLDGTYGGAGGKIFGASGTIVGPFDVGDDFSAKVTNIPAGTEGNATFTATVRAVTSPADYCLPDPSGEASKSWGFWVGKKADLSVDAAGITLLEHKDLDDVPAPTNHNTTASADDMYTRYPNVPPTCFEEDDNNVSRYHLRIPIRNSGDARFSPTDSDLPLPLRVQVRDEKGVIASQVVEASIPIGASRDVLLNASVFSLVNRAGLQNLRVDIDPQGRYVDKDRGNNVYTTPTERTATGAIYVRAPDLTGALSGVELDSQKKVSGSAVMTNAGDQLAGVPAGNSPESGICHSRNGLAVVARVYLDKVEPDNLLRAFEASLGPGGSTPSVSFSSNKSLGAGAHRILLVLDPRNSTGLDAITELNETNNLVVHTENLTIADLLVPVVSQVAVKPPPADRRAGVRLNISGNVSDDADFTLEGNNVFLDMTFPSGRNITFTVPKQTLNESDSTKWSGFNNTNGDSDVHWQFSSTYDEVGTYAFRIRATDSVPAHNVTFPALTLPPLSFELTEFSKAMELISIEVCRDSAVGQPTDCSGFQGNSTQPANLTYQDNDLVRIRFKVPAGATGLADELKSTARKTVEIRDPDYQVLGNYTVKAICLNNGTTPPSYQDCLGTEPDRCDPPLQVCYVGAYQVLVGNGRSVNVTQGQPFGQSCSVTETNTTTRFLKPAQYNVSFWVGDNACRFKGHAPEQQANPLRFRFGLWDTVNATLANTTLQGLVNGALPAGNSALFRTDAYDNHKVNRTFVRVLRGSQQVHLEDLALVTPFNATTGNGTYSRSVATGIHTALDLAGDYQWIVGAQDANRTLSWSQPNGTTCTPDYTGCTPTPRTFRLDDLRLPGVSGEGAFLRTATGVDNQAKSAFQVGEEFVLQARATDDTRITVTADVQSAAGIVVLDDLPMTRVEGDLYRSENITTGPGARLPEGEYRIVVRVVDSAQKQVESAIAVPFRVSSNLPPTFSQRTPADQGFGPPNGTVGVDVSDTLQGVLLNSIAVRFGVNTPGQAATPVAAPVITEREKRADGVPTLVRASFQLPSTVRHGDTVTVAVEASDGSTPPLAGNTTWTFKVDGLAPRSAISCTRSHPSACGSEGPQAVRGDSLITLSAQDVDPENKARSGVAAVRYSLAFAAQTVTTQSVTGDNATFRLSQHATQDGFYTLRFRAVDAAGNEEPERSLVIALDTQGPGIQNPLATPTSSGWNVTATITDIASDVRTARVFVRAGATAYEERPMARIPDTQFWFASLPGARRGAQVCYYLEAVDFLDNVATNGTAASPVCFASENHPPQLTVLSPREGESVGASMTVRWSVTDIDNDPVTVAVHYRRSGEVQFLAVPLSTEEQGQRSKIVDTGDLVAGTYQLRVTASDNQAFNNRTERLLNVTIGGGASDLTRPQLDKTSVAPGEVFQVKVEIARPAVNVEARLLRGGDVVGRAAMDQDPPGSRFYVAEFRISDPGVYEVEVSGEYEDTGTPFVIKGASTLTVRGGFAALDAAVIGLLGAVVVALGLLGLRRRGWL